MKHIAGHLLFILLLAGCGSKPIVIQSFDSAQWLADVNGCQGKRLAIAQTIIKQKEALLKHTQNDIEAYLGKPDEHELYQRSRKYFYYYLEPGPKCGSGAENTYPAKISIRFNATGFANEILIIR